MASSNNFSLFSKDSQDGNRKKEKELNRDEASVSQVEEESVYIPPGQRFVEEYQRNVDSKTKLTYFANNGIYSPGFGPKRKRGSALKSNVPSSSGNLTKFCSLPEPSSTYSIRSSFSPPQLQSRIGFPDSSITSNEQSIVNVYDSRSRGNAQRSYYSLSNVHSTFGHPDSNSTLQHNNAQTAYSLSNVNPTDNVQNTYKLYDSSSTCNESLLSPYDSSSTSYVQRTWRTSDLLPNSNTTAFVESTDVGHYDQRFTAINQNKGMTCVGFSDSTYKGKQEIRNFTGHSWSEDMFQKPETHEYSRYNDPMCKNIVKRLNALSCTDYSQQSSDIFNVQKAVSENLKGRSHNQEHLKKKVPNFFKGSTFYAGNVDDANLEEKAQEEKGKEVTFEFMKLDESKTKKTKLKEREDKLKYSVCEAANLANTGNGNNPKSNEQPSQAESQLQSDEEAENQLEAGKKKGKNKRKQ